MHCRHDHWALLAFQFVLGGGPLGGYYHDRKYCKGVSPYLTTELFVTKELGQCPGVGTYHRVVGRRGLGTGQDRQRK